MKMKTQQPKPMGFIKSSAKEKVHSNTSLLQEISEIPNKQPKAVRKRTEKHQS